MLHGRICRHQVPARSGPCCGAQQVTVLSPLFPPPPPGLAAVPLQPSHWPSTRSRRATLASAAQLALALTEPGHASADAPLAWQRVQRMAELHPADASTPAAVAAAMHAPAYVRAHYLLALLHWLLAALAGKHTATPGRAQRAPGAVAHDDAAPEPQKKRRRTENGALEAAASSAVSGASRSAVSKASNAADETATDDAAVLADAGAWWLLAAVLSSGALPQQEVQVGALLKPLISACQPAMRNDATPGATRRWQRCTTCAISSPHSEQVGRISSALDRLYDDLRETSATSLRTSLVAMTS